MQTFVPYPDINLCARSLDTKRLGKQRSESKIILQTLAKKKAVASDAKIGWKNHPAVLMWEGHEDFLKLYSIAICTEWIKRGYEDTTLPFFLKGSWTSSPTPPIWWGDEKVHESHRSKLISKNETHYMPLFHADTQINLDYYWPRSTHNV